LTENFPAILGKAVLLAWTDVPVVNEVEFNEWYSYEHIRERVGIPGFKRARRFMDAGIGLWPGKWFTMFEAEDLEVLESDVYLERMEHPTDWTKQMVQLATYGARSCCSVTVSVGEGTSSYVMTIEMRPARGRADELRSWLVEALQRLVGERKILAGHLFEVDNYVTNAYQFKKADHRRVDRQRPSEEANWISLLEVGFDSSVAVEHILTGSGGIHTHGAESGQVCRFFREMSQLSSK
jgi:hypothetical protein